MKTCFHRVSNTFRRGKKLKKNKFDETAKILSDSDFGPKRQNVDVSFILLYQKVLKLEIQTRDNNLEKICIAHFN